jgi:hypothetical protein
MTEDEIHAAILMRAQSLSKRLATLTVVGALLSGLLAVYLAVGDAGRGGILWGKMIGLTGGLTFTATFATVLLVGTAVGRRYIAGRLRRWTHDAVSAHGLEEGSLDYVVAMYEKPSGPPSTQPR